MDGEQLKSVKDKSRGSTFQLEVGLEEPSDFLWFCITIIITNVAVIQIYTLSPCGLLLGGSDSVQWVQQLAAAELRRGSLGFSQALQSVVNRPCSIISLRWTEITQKLQTKCLLIIIVFFKSDST